MAELIALLPEISIALTLAAVVFAEVTYQGERNRLVASTALMGLAAAFLQLLLTYGLGPRAILSGAFAVDGFALFFKGIFILLAALTILAAEFSTEIQGARRPEHHSLVLGCALAMCLVASSVDLVLAFLALQLTNTLIFFLAGYEKKAKASIGASLQYMVMSAVSGMLFLYGGALLFSISHSLEFAKIHEVVAQTGPSDLTVSVALVLMLLALSFQMGTFPMHLWAADVYQGTPTPVLSFIAVGGRAAGFALAARIFLGIFGQKGVLPGTWAALGPVSWPLLLAVASGATALFGGFLILVQTSVKRVMGGLVIFSSGFILVGPLVMDQVGMSAVLFEFVAELFAMVGAAYLLGFFIEEMGSDRLDALEGGILKHPLEAIFWVIFLMSWVGLPPLPGFMGKFALLGSVYRHGWDALALVLVVSWVLATAGTARLCFKLIQHGSLQGSSEVYEGGVVPVRRKVLLALLGVPLFLLVVFSERVLQLTGASLGSILW